MTKPDKITQTLKPSDFLRNRRPEKYSDSIVTETPQITRDVLEYHLDTLTNRSQEKEFEHFARKLAEKELCPNLLPQTGPTGGGDSKVDSETYPVSEEISIAWYQGNASANERWGFAISAKKEWKSKFKSDVKKALETNRGYSLIYFITNQFVRDKLRAEVEDKLKKEFGVETHILDRSWIVDRVINHDRLEIAAKTLSIESLQLRPSKKIGPIDAKREVELKELDKEINDPERYIGKTYQLAEDCLQSAILASELELNRHEVDGRFSAALRVAEKVGDRRQTLRMNYRHAWVSCFVYDDVAQMSRLYDKVEELGLSSSNADDIELVNNLWNVLFANASLENSKQQDFKVNERGNRLKKRLEELSSDDARPNNSLNIKTMLCFHRLTELQQNKSDPKNIDLIFNELETIIENSRNLGQYPFDSYKEIIFELGEFYVSNEAYDKLFNRVLDVQQERTSEGEAGAALVNRGVQKFKAGMIYEAVKEFGRAQEKLIKEEYHMS